MGILRPVERTADPGRASGMYFKGTD
ncbi:hypothetical protein SIAM614_24957 [Roseibium aggregatum IAM 12614]|uniref:Uncharacterized protein n=1 Tax=Roseibium aggregatum (strain ATCC 25650 / DSM 13394 / JCM 20685 / NBRC 16684 / NCIMB 2208 / IAM 12614 / B1) TaxID=384765 RepID=A0NYS8_ROSAI|nr:hypothetical protein SIAM614_24957 [Roseibium aggregatum IAM 12614]